MLCDICGKAFAIAIDFYKHYVTHENSSLLKCSLCEIKCSDAEDAPKHVCYKTTICTSKKYKTLVEKYNPENCGVSKLSEETLFTLLNSSPKKSSGTKAKPKKVKNNVVNRSKTEKITLSKRVKNIKADKDIKVECAPGTYRCDICRRLFHEREIFETHRSRHGVKGHFTCETCGKEFKEKLFFQVHTMAHKEQKPLKCDKCPEIFSDIVAYKRHRGGHKYKECKIQRKVNILKSQLNEKLVSS